jgi:transaldolase
MPEGTLEDFEDHGTLARTVDTDVDAARRAFDDLGELGIDMEDVASTLEEEGVASFTKSYDELLASLDAKADDLRR